MSIDDVTDAGDSKADGAAGLLATEDTELMNRELSCVVKYDRDDANPPPQSTLSNNSQNRLYEKLGFPRHRLQTIGIIGN